MTRLSWDHYVSSNTKSSRPTRLCNNALQMVTSAWMYRQEQYAIWTELA